MLTWQWYALIWHCFDSGDSNEKFEKWHDSWWEWSVCEGKMGLSLLLIEAKKTRLGLGIRVGGLQSIGVDVIETLKSSLQFISNYK